MAYPKARGGNPLSYEEYDPTPFSGGYDQAALYGRPKSPSAETCYPISESSHHQGGSYGAETTPYLPDAGYGSGYGRPNPNAYEGGGGYGSGYGRPTYEEEGGSYGSHNTSSYEEEGGAYSSGYGRLKPEFEEGGQEFGSGYWEGEEGYGRALPKPGYGGGGFSRPYEDEGYGGFHEKEEDTFGRKPGDFEDQRPHWFGGEGSLFGEEEEGGFGRERRPGGFQSDEYGGDEGYGGRKKYSDYEGETGDRSGFFGGDWPFAPPADEGYGGYQGEEHHKHYWRHDED